MMGSEERRLWELGADAAGSGILPKKEGGNGRAGRKWSLGDHQDQGLRALS